MGHCRRKSSHVDLRHELLIEAVARIARHDINASWRQKALAAAAESGAHVDRLDDPSFFRTIVSRLNLWLGRSARYDQVQMVQQFAVLLVQHQTTWLLACLLYQRHPTVAVDGEAAATASLFRRSVLGGNGPRLRPAGSSFDPRCVAFVA